MQFEQLCLDTCVAARQVGAFIAKQAISFDPGVAEEKSINQLVSYVDKQAEEQLVERLQKLLPAAGFITEEETIKHQQNEFTWVIDPLDGTTNFVHGLPVYCISIGLLHEGKTVLGVIYDPSKAELFYACEGSAAMLNGHQIYVSKTKRLNQSLLATGFPYYDFEWMESYLETLRTFMKETRGMRRMGSAAIDLAYVACGKFDGFFEYGLNAWDVCAGAYIVSRAGGVVSGFDTNSNFLFDKEIIAASPAIHNQMQQVIAGHFARP
jgi:myo-inositol-1(or 4)-monophosphatase